MSEFITLIDRPVDIRDCPLKPESVDYIVCDPPYGAEFLHVWDLLGQLALKVLKPGGSLLAMGGTFHLPEYLLKLSTCLKFHWVMPVVCPDYAYIIWPAKVQSAWKPVFWFTKGDYQGNSVNDLIQVKQGKINKYHKWSQSIPVFRSLIKKIIPKPDPAIVVYDPCMGGGCTLIACAILGIHCIGSDLDPGCLSQTRKHITEYFAWISNSTRLPGQAIK